jgi:hypothetical protein
MVTVIHCFIVHNSCVDTDALRERAGVRGFKKALIATIRSITSRRRSSCLTCFLVLPTHQTLQFA